MTPLDQLVNHWREIYSSNNPSKELQSHDGRIPGEIEKYFQFEVYPEPFYGYINEKDLLNDALLLLINPGEFTGGTQDISNMNSFTITRYTTWTKKEYMQEKSLLKRVNSKGLKWRERMKKQVERVIPEPKRINFLHTMELFPYHSKKWTDLSEEAKTWMMNTKTTKLNFEAIKFLAVTRKLNYIIGIGITWLDIFARFGYEPTHYKPFYNEKGNFSHRLFMYKLTEEASPIVIYVASSMNLPKDQHVVEHMEKLLSQ